MFFVLLEQLFWLKKNYVFKKYFTKNSSKDDLILMISLQGTQWCSRILIWIYGFGKYSCVMP